MDLWKRTVEEVEVLIKDGYTIKIAGVHGKEGWWAINHVPYKSLPSYRIEEEIINDLKNSGYIVKETVCSFILVKP